MTRLRLQIRGESGGQPLTPAAVERLLALLETDHSATLVTLEGDRDAFCEGMDFSQLVRRDDDVAAVLDRFRALLHALSTTARPVIALVGGPAMGGGVGLAAAADLVLATPHATFGLPEVVFGLVPAMVLPFVARRVGPSRARWLAMNAATITAAEALRLGLVDEVVDDLEAGLARHARRLSHLDRRAVGEAKALATEYENALDGYYTRATAVFTRLLTSGDARDRIGRFLAGDTPWADAEAT